MQKDWLLGQEGEVEVGAGGGLVGGGVVKVGEVVADVELAGGPCRSEGIAEAASRVDAVVSAPFQQGWA